MTQPHATVVDSPSAIRSDALQWLLIVSAFTASLLLALGADVSLLARIAVRILISTR